MNSTRSPNPLIPYPTTGRFPAFAAVASAFGRLELATKRRLASYASLRVVAALFDLLGVMFVSAFTTEVIAATSTTEIELPAIVSLIIPRNATPLILLLLGVVSLSLKSMGSLALTYLQTRLLNAECSRQIDKFAETLSKQDLGTIGNFSSQRLHFLATASIRSSTSGILGPAITLFAELSVLVVLVAFLVSTSLIASLASLGFLGGASILLYLYVGRRQYRLGQLLGSANVRSISVFQESIHGFREFFIRGKLKGYLQKFSGIESEFSQIQTLQTLNSNIPRYLLETLVMLGLGLLAAISSVGNNAAQSLVLITVFSAAAARILPSLIPIQAAISELQTNLGLSADLRDLILLEDHTSRETEVRKLSALPHDGSCHVRLQDVSFRYQPESPLVISHVNLEMSGPGWISIDGPSGTGKSTFFDLVMGIREPTSGTITIDGMAPRDFIHLNPGMCGYLPQRITALNASLAENVALGTEREDIDSDRVEQLLQTVGLSGLLAQSPHGIWTPLGEMAQTISGGQFQRIGIARCLYTSPRLLLLDESTTGLDSESREGVLDIVSHLAKEILVVSISHDREVSGRASVRYSINSGSLRLE